MNNQFQTADGYARVITDLNGKIISVEEWYSYDKKLHDYLTGCTFQEWIDELDVKNSEVLLTYKLEESKTWTDWGYEYDSELHIINETILGSNYKQKLYNKIKVMQIEELNIINDLNENVEDIFYNNMSDKKDINIFKEEIKELISQYEEWYEEDFE